MSWATSASALTRASRPQSSAPSSRSKSFSLGWAKPRPAWPSWSRTSTTPASRSSGSSSTTTSSSPAPSSTLSGSSLSKRRNPLGCAPGPTSSRPSCWSCSTSAPKLRPWPSSKRPSSASLTQPCTSATDAPERAKRRLPSSWLPKRSESTRSRNCAANSTRQKCKPTESCESATPRSRSLTITRTLCSCSMLLSVTCSLPAAPRAKPGTLAFLPQHRPCRVRQVSWATARQLRASGLLHVNGIALCVYMCVGAS
mmetsp:Transcript_11408/g.36509  ORF Transcript_11408/g.36509 Transcript_11408/m.36509 type:complete len:255 (-) Transcript_11408:182-946(-)